MNNAILDSGNRTEFGSGAVRDMQDDKGRCDLMPLGVVQNILFGEYETHYGVLNSLERYKETHDVEWLYNAAASFLAVHYPVHVETAMLELSIHFAEGAKKYGENNWQKGLPEWSYISSAVRHYLKFRRSDKDERHDRAFLWNVVCLIWTIEHKVEVKG